MPGVALVVHAKGFVIVSLYVTQVLLPPALAFVAATAEASAARKPPAQLRRSLRRLTGAGSALQDADHFASLHGKRRMHLLLICML